MKKARAGFVAEGRPLLLYSPAFLPLYPLACVCEVSRGTTRHVLSLSFVEQRRNEEDQVPPEMTKWGKGEGERGKESVANERRSRTRSGMERT